MRATCVLVIPARHPTTVNWQTMFARGESSSDFCSTLSPIALLLTSGCRNECIIMLKRPLIFLPGCPAAEISMCTSTGAAPSPRLRVV